ncbi:hypothetical protein WK09_02390 [Burkholderia ubonensis]|nr:hypothetical protein WK09_02390 [Burkholderia ubonensis]
MENHSGVMLGAAVSRADGFAERASALRLLDCGPGRHAKTLGADKGYDMRDFVRDCRARKVKPHVARNDAHQGGSTIDGRTSRHVGRGISQVIRKRIDEHFGWARPSARFDRTRIAVNQHFKLTMLASNMTPDTAQRYRNERCNELPKRGHARAGLPAWLQQDPSVTKQSNVYETHF